MEDFIFDSDWYDHSEQYGECGEVEIEDSIEIPKDLTKKRLPQNMDELRHKFGSFSNGSMQRDVENLDIFRPKDHQSPETDDIYLDFSEGIVLEVETPKTPIRSSDMTSQDPIGSNDFSSSLPLCSEQPPRMGETVNVRQIEVPIYDIIIPPPPQNLPSTIIIITPPPSFNEVVSPVNQWNFPKFYCSEEPPRGVIPAKNNPLETRSNVRFEEVEEDNEQKQNPKKKKTRKLERKCREIKIVKKKIKSRLAVNKNKKKRAFDWHKDNFRRKTELWMSVLKHERQGIMGQRIALTFKLVEKFLNVEGVVVRELSYYITVHFGPFRQDYDCFDEYQCPFRNRKKNIKKLGKDFSCNMRIVERTTDLEGNPVADKHCSLEYGRGVRGHCKECIWEHKKRLFGNKRIREPSTFVRDEYMDDHLVIQYFQLETPTDEDDRERMEKKRKLC